MRTSRIAAVLVVVALAVAGCGGGEPEPRPTGERCMGELLGAYNVPEEPVGPALPPFAGFFVVYRELPGKPELEYAGEVCVRAEATDPNAEVEVHVERCLPAANGERCVRHLGERASATSVLSLSAAFVDGVNAPHCLYAQATIRRHGRPIATGSTGTVISDLQSENGRPAASHCPVG